MVGAIFIHFKTAATTTSPIVKKNIPSILEQNEFNSAFMGFV